MRLETHGATPRQYLFGLWKYLVERFRNYAVSSRVVWLLFKMVDRQVLKLAQRPFRKARKGTTQEIGSSWSNFAAHEIKRVPKLTKDKKADIFAMYLPQFHQFERNDSAWGEGFTEWTNVVRSVPLFEGHGQPVLPSNFGFYDLRTPGVIEKQIRLAKEFGISGFLVFVYWFDNFAEMDLPLKKLVVACEKLNFKIALQWANEPWTRKWDGLSKDVIIDIPRNLTAKNATAMVRHYSRIFKSPAYLKHKGKPVFFIYNPGHFLGEWVSTLRASFKRVLKSQVFMVGMQIFGQNHRQIISMGMDESAEYYPHNFSEFDRQVNNLRLNSSVKQIWIHDYEASVLKLTSSSTRNGVPSCFPSWDNSPRRTYDGSNVFVNCRASLFEMWLRDCLDRSIERHKKNMLSVIIINAWNEWAEGAILEPTSESGFAYLNALGRVLEE